MKEHNLSWFFTMGKLSINHSPSKKSKLKTPYNSPIIEKAEGQFLDSSTWTKTRSSARVLSLGQTAELLFCEITNSTLSPKSSLSQIEDQVRYNTNQWQKQHKV